MTRLAWIGVFALALAWVLSPAAAYARPAATIQAGLPGIVMMAVQLVCLPFRPLALAKISRMAPRVVTARAISRSP